MSSNPSSIAASESFNKAAPANQDDRKRKKPVPFSLRLSAEERARLEAEAGGKPLGVYIRERLLGKNADKRRLARKPRIDRQ